MATTTIDTYLLDGGLATGVQTFTVPLVAINDMPDLEGEIEEIDVTSLSDDTHVAIDGLRSNEPWVFTCNYTKTSYETLKALIGLKKHYAVFLGPLSTASPTGSDGMWAVTGYLSVQKKGGGVGEAHSMSVKVVKSSVVTFYALPTIVGVTMSAPVESAVVSLSAIKYVGIPVGPTLAYQWYTAATETGTYSEIGGATSATYTPGESDAGDWIKVKITATGTATGVIYSTPAIVVAN
jgi:hypothetical protein